MSMRPLKSMAFSSGLRLLPCLHTPRIMQRIAVDGKAKGGTHIHPVVHQRWALPGKQARHRHSGVHTRYNIVNSSSDESSVSPGGLSYVIPEAPVMITRHSTLPSDPLAWHSCVLLVDKPKGWTSFDVCNKIRGAVKMKKVGHAGTLDPMATGLLVVCVAKATKRVEEYMGMSKQYTGTLRLGEGTPSYDAETGVEERLPWEHISDADLEVAQQSFLGEIDQLPPMFSALKVGGKKLCDEARKGREVERQPRKIHIYDFKLTRDHREPQDVNFSVTCSKGTYVRSLAYDLAHRVGSTAHLTALRRTAIGQLSVEDAWAVSDLVGQVKLLDLPDMRKKNRNGKQQTKPPTTPSV